MNQPSISLSTPLYRPKKIPRVLKSQFSVMRLTAIIIALGAVALMIAYRNIAHERLTIEIAQNRAGIATLEEEIQQLHGQIESETSYPKIAAWAEKNYGWRPITGRKHDLILKEGSLTNTALFEYKTGEATHD